MFVNVRLFENKPFKKGSLNALHLKIFFLSFLAQKYPSFTLLNVQESFPIRFMLSDSISVFLKHWQHFCSSLATLTFCWQWRCFVAYRLCWGWPGRTSRWFWLPTTACSEFWLAPHPSNLQTTADFASPGWPQSASFDSPSKVWCSDLRWSSTELGTNFCPIWSNL